MAKLQQMFDATQTAPATSGNGQLPIGRHMVVITDSEIKGNKANTGGMLVTSLQVIEGSANGHTGVNRYNLYNENPKAVEIAHAEFSALCHVLKVFKVEDSAQLHNIPFMIDVAQQKDNPEYTEVKRVMDNTGCEAGKTTPSPLPAAPVEVTPSAQPEAKQEETSAQTGWNNPTPEPAKEEAAPAQGGWNQPATGAVADKPAWAN